MIPMRAHVIFKGPAPHHRFQNLIGKKAIVVDIYGTSYFIQFDNDQILMVCESQLELLEGKILQFPKVK